MRQPAARRDWHFDRVICCGYLRVYIDELQETELVTDRNPRVP